MYNATVTNVKGMGECCRFIIAEWQEKNSGGAIKNVGRQLARFHTSDWRSTRQGIRPRGAVASQPLWAKVAEREITGEAPCHHRKITSHPPPAIIKTNNRTHLIAPTPGVDRIHFLFSVHADDADYQRYSTET